MAWSFGDGFDCYAAITDAYPSYWDTSTAGWSLTTGRFAGSRGPQPTAAGGTLTKNSGANDAVHHLVIAFQQTAAISGTTLGTYLELFDGATAQCSIVFRSDGAILLTSGAPNGTVLATYTGAVTANNTWYAFEFEVVINNTTGSFTVRKNGNTSNDFTLGSLNTRPTSTNNYANKLTVGQQVSVGAVIDDLFWRSDASSVAWLGDIRCYTRMPASDSSVTFARAPTAVTFSPVVAGTVLAISTATARYTPFTPVYTGTIGTATVTLSVASTSNMKCSIFASSGTAPTTVLGSANIVANPILGVNTLTFGTPVLVNAGVQYWIGFSNDATSGQFSCTTSATAGAGSTTAYASFPVASPTASASQAPVVSLTISLTANFSTVAEPQQDGTTSYVYDSTPGDADFYGIVSIASTPSVVVAVTTRGYMQKSDAGTRTAAVQLRSGGTTVASPTLVLATPGWLWAWRTDTVDPATSAAWTATGVNNVTIGPVTIA